MIIITIIMTIWSKYFLHIDTPECNTHKVLHAPRIWCHNDSVFPIFPWALFKSYVFLRHLFIHFVCFFVCVFLDHFRITAPVQVLDIPISSLPLPIYDPFLTWIVVYNVHPALFWPCWNVDITQWSVLTQSPPTSELIKQWFSRPVSSNEPCCK